MLVVDTPNLWEKGRATSDNFEGKCFPKERVLAPVAGQRSIQRTSQEEFKA